MGGKKVGSSAHPITDFDLPVEPGSTIERTPMGKGMRAPGTGGTRAPGSRVRRENEDAPAKKRK